MKKKNLAVSNSIHQIQKRIFSTQFILILLLAIVLGGAGIIINVTFETQKRDRNLQNISQTIATSPLLDDMAISDAINASGILNKRIPLVTSYTAKQGESNLPPQAQIDEGGRPSAEMGDIDSEGQESSFDAGD